MRNCIRSVLVVGVLCCLPIVFLSPLLFGAGPCPETPKRSVTCWASLGEG